MSPPRIACIGECMGELRPHGDQLELGFAGDTFNAAAYLARAGVASAFVSMVGRDQISTQMLDAMNAHGVNTELVLAHPSRTIGLYLITTDENGERSFTYWREQSAARALLDDGRDQYLADALAAFDLIYLSGISLGILDEAAQRRLLALLRELNLPVAFDLNFRRALWPDVEKLRQLLEQLAPLCRFVKTSVDDQTQVWPTLDHHSTVSRWQALGAQEVVMTAGTEPLWVGTRQIITVPVQYPVSALDTTGAGDGFNATYIAARLAGQPVEAACEAAQALAAQVVRVPGALL